MLAYKEGFGGVGVRDYVVPLVRCKLCNVKYIKDDCLADHREKTVDGTFIRKERWYCVRCIKEGRIAQKNKSSRE